VSHSAEKTKENGWVFVDCRGNTADIILPTDADDTLLYIGAEARGFTNKVNRFHPEYDMNAVGIFADYLEDNIEQSELRDRVIRYYRGVFNGSVV
jgi:hypothetical protein